MRDNIQMWSMIVQHLEEMQQHMSHMGSGESGGMGMHEMHHGGMPGERPPPRPPPSKLACWCRTRQQALPGGAGAPCHWALRRCISVGG